MAQGWKKCENMRIRLSVCVGHLLPLHAEVSIRMGPRAVAVRALPLTDRLIAGTAIVVVHAAPVIPLVPLMGRTFLDFHLVAMPGRTEPAVRTRLRAVAGSGVDRG